MSLTAGRSVCHLQSNCIRRQQPAIGAQQAYAPRSAAVCRSGATAAPGGGSRRADDPGTCVYHKAAGVQELPPAPAGTTSCARFEGEQLGPTLQGTALTAVRVTLPRPASGEPHPVVVLFSAFLVPARYYSQLCERVAPAGFAVVQYEVPLLNLFNVDFVHKDVWVDAFPLLVSWLRQQSSAQDGELAGRLDLDRLCVAGHSRGGKLAAINYASPAPGVSIKACYLMDPVDEFPTSGVEALLGKDLPLRAMGYCRTGALNPERSNFRHFLAAAGPGSQLQELPLATHLRVLDDGILTRHLWDAIDIACLAPGAERLGNVLYDFLSSQPRDQDPSVTLQALMEGRGAAGKLQELLKLVPQARRAELSLALEMLLGSTEDAAQPPSLGGSPRGRPWWRFWQGGSDAAPAAAGQATTTLDEAVMSRPTVVGITAAALVKWLHSQLQS